MLNENVNNQTKEVFDTIPIPRNIKKLKGRVDKLKEEKKLSLEREAKKEGISYENLIKNKEDAAAYTVASMTPLLGDAIAIKELPNDIQEIKNLFEQGFREGDFKKLGLGTLYTAAVTAGILPFAGVVGRAGKNVIKSSLDKAKPLYDKQIEMMSGFPPSGPDALATANNVPVKSVNETDKLLDKANINKPIDTSLPPSIKPDEYLNAPKINPTMSGMNTPTGKLQGRRFLDLEGKGNITPEKLFEQTQVYRGQDGKLRWEIDTTDAKLKFDDTLDMRRGNYQLSNILDFDRLYKEYYKDIGAGYVALRNLKVRVRGVGDSEGTLGSYNRDLDRITLNMKAINVQAAKDAKELGIPLNDAINLQVESTLLHEVQHAVQAREGFTRGSNLDNFLRKGFTKDYEANATLQDSILFRLSNDLKDGLDYMTDNRKLGFLSDIEVRSKRINEIENLPASTKTDAIKKEYMDLTALRARDLEQVDLPKAIKKKIFTNFNKAMDENARQKKLLDKEELVAYGKYRDVYGEKEARLVQKRFEDRYAMSKMAGKDIARDEVKRDTKFLNDSDGLGKMGGFNKGGTTMNMNKQMEMFDEGGLKEEGGTIDPVSGNDVPIGSTQEEVRDDIPAQLSEGEFVFPADVVRFIGLEKLMMMRQEAKAGLKRMEEMGQMGNSEEATMPDDMPFDINDLDMEDEREYNRDSQEMNQGGMVRVGGKEMPKPRIQGQQFADGGVVQAQSGTFVAPGSGVTTVPSQFAGQNLPSYNANQTLQKSVRPAYTVPTIPAVTTGYDPKFMTGQEMQTNQTAPSFETLIGKNPGQYDEMRTYKNDAGATLQIPFKNGQPIYPIPEGYIFVDPEEEQTEKPTVQSVRPTTTQAQVDGDNDSGTRVGTTMIGKTGKGITDKSLSTNQKTGIVMSALDKATTKGSLGVALNTLGTLGVPGAAALGGFDSINPDRTALDDVLGQYGYNATTANAALNDPMAAIGLNQQQAANMANSISLTELSSPAVQEALSQAMYGMSKAQATAMLGVAPNTTLGIKGYKPGQVDPTTNATYSINGQATDDDNNVSYTDMNAFGNAMNASAKSGYFGGEKQAQKDAAKGNPKAKAFLSYLNKNTKYGKDVALGAISDKEFGDDSGPGPGDGGGATGDPDDDDSAATDTGTASASGTAGQAAAGSSQTDSGPGSDDNPDATDNSESGTGDAESMGDDGGMGPTAKGGLVGKKKPKVKKMKRGGLASR